MSQPKKRRKPRIKIPESTQSDWRKKVHPFFIRMLEYNNRVTALSSSPNEADRKKAQRLTKNPPRKLVEEAHRMHDAIPPAERPQHDAYLSIFGVADAPEGGTMSEGQFTLGWLAFNKFGKSIVELAAGDAAGDVKSSRQLLSVQRDYQNWRYGKLDVNKMHFKFDSHHILIMQTGLELGFRALTPMQLADCYDEVCNCGETHDPENMKKLRTRVIKIMDRLAKNLSVK
ncbi:MAG: hypothetical protein WA757_07160 [Candidatus Acidiferrales bacterium]